MKKVNRYKYTHRRVTPDEFRALLASAGISVRDFLFLTGRAFDQVDGFVRQKALGDRRAYTPTMGDVLLLEVASRHPGMAQTMNDIVNEYSAENGNDGQ